MIVLFPRPPVNIRAHDFACPFSFFPDLKCNNPMTKEPKLQAAVRIVAEWSDYDQEIKRLQTRVQEGANHTTKQQGTGTQHSSQASGKWRTYMNTRMNSTNFLFFPSDVHTELWGAEAAMRQRTELCLKSLLHEQAPLRPVVLLSDWSRTSAKHKLSLFFL